MYYVEYKITHNYPETGAESDTVSRCGYAPLSKTAKQILADIVSKLDNADTIEELHITRDVR